MQAPWDFLESQDQRSFTTSEIFHIFYYMKYISKNKPDYNIISKDFINFVVLKVGTISCSPYNPNWGLEDGIPKSYITCFNVFISTWTTNGLNIPKLYCPSAWFQIASSLSIFKDTFSSHKFSKSLLSKRINCPLPMDCTPCWSKFENWC